jgi:predicted dehydrogenase
MEKVLLIGASQMAIDYFNVLKALKCEVTVVGRSENSAIQFEEKTGQSAFIGGLELFINQNSVNEYNFVIVAVGIEELKSTCIMLLKNGVKNILLEKPGGINSQEINEIYQLYKSSSTSIFIAYNRRFYSSVSTAKKMIIEDGGPTSFHFEFTEWSHKIAPLQKNSGVKEAWFVGNSTHVVDMAFFLGGKPDILHSIAKTPSSWHSVTNFVGCGSAKNGSLFSYQANWNAPGRWVVEIMTQKNRFIFKPLEELKIQKLGSVEINNVVIENEMDLVYKPGLYTQTKAFLENDTTNLKSIEEQLADFTIYEKMLQI